MDGLMVSKYKKVIVIKKRAVKGNEYHTQAGITASGLNTRMMDKLKDYEKLIDVKISIRSTLTFHEGFERTFEHTEVVWYSDGVQEHETIFESLLTDEGHEIINITKPAKFT